MKRELNTFFRLNERELERKYVRKANSVKPKKKNRKQATHHSSDMVGALIGSVIAFVLVLGIAIGVLIGIRSGNVPSNSSGMTEAGSAAEALDSEKKTDIVSADPSEGSDGSNGKITTTEAVNKTNEESSQDVKIIRSGQGGDADWVLDDKGTLTISGNGAVSKDEDGRASWYEFAGSIKSVIIESGITTLSFGCFGDLVNMTEAELPDTLEYIDEYVFENCYSLSRIHIPQSVKYIAGNAFVECNALSEITVDEENSYFCESEGVLYDRFMKKLIRYPTEKTDTNFTIPDSVTEIGRCAFYECGRLTSVTLNNDLEKIDEWAFFGCSGLECVSLHGMIKSIGKFAFENCDGLTEVTIPSGISYIGEGAFGYYCDADNVDKLVEGFKIRCTQDSAAESYAKNNGIEYEYLTIRAVSPSTPVAKPVIYLYPEQKTDINVQVFPQGSFWTTYPKYGDNGWNITAYPDGRIVNKADGHSYDYLFWDSRDDRSGYEITDGFCVKGEDTESFLREKLTQIGLNEREMNEFIVYWLPLMEHNKYNLISFDNTLYCMNNELWITPEPDSLLRVFMTFKASDNRIALEPQSFKAFERKGFAVVEWGGCELS